MRPAAVVIAILFAGCRPAPGPAPRGQVTEYRGGRWFDGAGFVARTMWVVGDRLASIRPGRVDAVADLHDDFVVPPFAEGHNHWLEPDLIDAYVQVHLRDGIFYVKDHGTAPSLHDKMRSALNGPTSVDYISAHQGFTGPGGHPIELVDLLAGAGVLPAGWARTHGEGDAVFVVASEADIGAAWPRLLAGRPEFVKVFLVHSDEYAARRDDPKRSPKDRGMDPALVPAIVSRAHGMGLRVTAHIESAHDFHVAISAGADDIAHLPFVDAKEPERYRLADADVRAAGARRTTVATTLEWLADATPNDPRLAVTRDNLARLRAAGAIITIGTDLFRISARAEVDRIAKLGLMSNIELLRAWSVDTPHAIFPGRDLGRLEAGAEASFLVLHGDPLADFAHTRAIVLRVKQGRRIAPRPIELPPFGG